MHPELKRSSKNMSVQSFACESVIRWRGFLETRASLYSVVCSCRRDLTVCTVFWWHLKKLYCWLVQKGSANNEKEKRSGFRLMHRSHLRCMVWFCFSLSLLSICLFSHLCSRALWLVQNSSWYFVIVFSCLCLILAGLSVEFPRFFPTTKQCSFESAPIASPVETDTRLVNS